MSAGETQLTGSSVTRRILGGALLVGVFTALVKLVAFGKEVLVASTYGRGDALEAFLIALVLPTMVASVIGGAFRQAFVPIYMRVRRNAGVDAADRLFQRSLGVALVMLVAIGALLFVAAPWLVKLIASGYAPDKLALAVGLLRWLTPLCLLSTLPAMLSAVLHAEERYVLVTLAQVGVPALTLGFLLWSGPEAGAGPLVAGVVAGFAVETGILWLALSRLGHATLPALRSGPALGEVLGQWMPAAGGMVFQYATILVDQAMAAHLVGGSVAALSYAYRIIGLPLGIATLSIGTAFLPVISDLAVAGQWQAFWKTVSRWMRVSLWGGFGLLGLIAVFRTPLVELIYQRGSFNEQDTLVVATVLGAYTGMIPFYVAGIIGVRALSSLSMNRVLFVIGGVNLATNVIGNILLSRWLGVTGIALATVLVYAISAVIIVGTLRWRRNRPESLGERNP